MLHVWWLNFHGPPCLHGWSLSLTSPIHKIHRIVAWVPKSRWLNPAQSSILMANSQVLISDWSLLVPTTAWSARCACLPASATPWWDRASVEHGTEPVWRWVHDIACIYIWIWFWYYDLMKWYLVVSLWSHTHMYTYTQAHFCKDVWDT